MTDDVNPPTFDGHDVVERKVKLTKAGDGLSEALALNGLDIVAGKTYDVVVRVKAGGAQFKPEKAGDEDGDYVRIDNLVCQSATVVDDSTVANALNQHEANVAEARAKAKEAKEGLERLNFDDATDDEQAAEDGVTPDDVADLTDDWGDEEPTGDEEGDGIEGDPDA